MNEFSIKKVSSNSEIIEIENSMRKKFVAYDIEAAKMQNKYMNNMLKQPYNESARFKWEQSMAEYRKTREEYDKRKNALIERLRKTISK